MKNTEADARLQALNKSRLWLASQSGYKVTTLYNVLNDGEKELTPRMASAFDRAFSEEEKMQQSPFSDQTKLWDAVLFTANEMIQIDKARKIAAYESLEEFMHDGVTHYADELLAKERFQAAAEDQALYKKTKNPTPADEAAAEKPNGNENAS